MVINCKTYHKFNNRSGGKTLPHKKCTLIIIIHILISSTLHSAKCVPENPCYLLRAYIAAEYLIASFHSNNNPLWKPTGLIICLGLSNTLVSGEARFQIRTQLSFGITQDIPEGNQAKIVIRKPLSRSSTSMGRLS